MNAIKTFCHLEVQRMTVASCDLCMKRNVLMMNSNIAFVPRKLACSLKKANFHSNSCRLHTFGALCQSMTQQSSRLDVLLRGKHKQRCVRHCYVPLAMAVGLLVGWAVLKLHKQSVCCVAEAAETAECHYDNKKEQTNQQCQVLSLEEAIHESDQLLQRVKVIYVKHGGYDIILIVYDNLLATCCDQLWMFL